MNDQGENRPKNGYGGNHTRSLPTIVVEIVEELNEFAVTRLELLFRELEEKRTLLKVIAPLVALAGMFLGTAFLTVTLALISLLAAAFQGGAFAWFYASLIVGFCWFVFGAIAAYLVRRELTKTGLLPRKTLAVLRADNNWLQQEAKDYLWAHQQ